MSSEDLPLRAIGFCGVDDSVSPHLLKLISLHYPWVEWGVLFRTDLKGTPRYPSDQWMAELAAITSGSRAVDAADSATDRSPAKRRRMEQQPMRLAAHLCADRCQQVLEGDCSFVQQLEGMGFKRVQVNATAANSVHVDASKMSDYIQNIVTCMQKFPSMEWIIQCNDETQPLWQGLAAKASEQSGAETSSEKATIVPPLNMSLLYDASCGKGVRVTSFPSPAAYPTIPCGYAGGIGPDCIEEIMLAVKQVVTEYNANAPRATATTAAAAATVTATASAAEKCDYRLRQVWVDMESSLRELVASQNKLPLGADASHADRFSIAKCYQCIRIAVKHGMAEEL